MSAATSLFRVVFAPVFWPLTAGSVRRRNLPLGACVFFGLLLLVSCTAQAQFFTGPYGPGGTWNLYEVVTTTDTWLNARNTAQAKAASATGVAGVAGNALTGHLVQITSADENTFVAGAATLTPKGVNSNVWIGLTDLNGERGSSQTGWEWAGTTGPEYLDAGEFNAWSANPNSTQNAVEMLPSGLWFTNNHNSTAVLRRYVIEWEIGAAGPITGAEQFPIYYTAPHGPGSTYNLYRLVFVPADFPTVHAAATAARADSTGVVGVSSGAAAAVTGHLISIGSDPEQHFAFRLSVFAGLNTASVWLGATDSPTYGGTDAGTSKTSGWVWAGTNEPFTYQRFLTRPPGGLEEPNGGQAENHVSLGGGNYWADTTVTNRLRYLVEWDIASPTPIAGAAQFAPILTGTRNLGQTATADEWIVRESRLISPSTAAISVGLPNMLYVANRLPADTVSTTGTRRNLNITDLSPSPAGTGRSFAGIFGNHLGYVADQPNTDDNNIICTAKSKLVLSGPGPYTVNLQCDDGFLLRITGATFSRVTGNGTVDPGDPSCVLNNGGTNIRAVFTVPAAGTYDVEYLGWEGGGASLIQLSYAQGAHSWDWDAVWTLMGGTPPSPPVLPQPVGSLPVPVAPADGSWGIRFLQSSDPGVANRNLAWALNQMTNNAGGATNHVTPVVNFADFNSRPTSGIFCGESDIPGSNTSIRDTYFVVTGRCLWNVPAAGTYTISVTSTNEAALRVRGAQFSGRINGFTTAWVDHADKSTIYWQPNGTTMRATVNVPAAGSYEVELIWYQTDNGAGSHCEVAYAPGAVANAFDSQDWKLMGNVSALTPVLPAGSLGNAPLAEMGNWGIHHVSNVGGNGVRDLGEAIAALTGSAWNHSYSFAPVINHSDPEGPGSGGLFLGDRSLPGNTGSRDDNFAFHAKAILDVPTEGYYTIGVQTSDGFALRIPGQRWAIGTGTGGIDPASPDTFFWPTRGSDTTATDRGGRGIIFLPPGRHPLEVISFDRLRGFYCEVFAAAGVQTAAPSFLTTTSTAPQWRLMGHVPTGNVAKLGIQSPGWTVLSTPPVQTTTPPGNPPFITTLAGAASWITSPQPGFTPSSTTATSINFTDPGTSNSLGFGSASLIGNTQSFPLNTSTPEGLDQNDNWFVCRMNGSLVVPAAGTYIVGFSGGGSAYLEFLTPSGLPTPQFSRITGDALEVATLNISSAGGPNARLTTDFQQVPHSTSGEVALQAGTYPVQALWYTGTVAAGIHLFASSSNPQAQVCTLISTTSTSAATGIVDVPSPLTLVGELPDLRVTNVTPPAGSIQSGQQVTFSWVVENVGPGSTASSTWSDRVVMSVNTTLGDGDDIPLGTFPRNGALPANGTYTATQSVTLPDGISGNYYLIVQTDTGNAINEGLQEGNNTTPSAGMFSVALAPYPDLIVSSVVAPPSAWTESAFDVTWTLTNQGPAAANGAWVDKVYLSADSQVGGDILLGVFPYSAGVTQGQSVIRTQTVSIPRAGITDGNYRIIVVTDADNNVFELPGEGNNATVRTPPIAVSLTLLPDLTIQSVNAPGTAFSSQTITVQWTVRNAGTGSTNAGQWFDKVFLSIDQTPDGSDAWQAEVVNASYLAGNESYTSSVDVKIPVGYSGNYYVIVATDSRNQVGEENEGNNARSRAISITLTPPPDLHVTTAAAPQNAFSGQSIPVNWTVQNNGTGPVPPDQASWSDTVYLSPSTTFNLGTARHLGSFNHTGALAVNGSYTLQNQNVTLPTALSGTHYVFVVTDSSNAVYEHVSENNNATRATAPIQITLTPPPDLIVPSVTTAATGTAGQPVSLTWTVRNQGAGDTVPGSWTDKVYLSTGSMDPQTATLLGSFSNGGSLGGGLSYSKTASVTLPNCISGPYYLFAVTDANANVFEFDPGFNAEANNAARTVSPIQITSTPPDLQVSTVTPPATGAAGQFVTIGWSVTNAGAGATGATLWNDRLYLSASPTFNAATAQVLGTFARNGLLAAAAGYTQSQQVPLPVTASGNYYLFVETDYSSQVEECSGEANNIGRSIGVLNVVSNPPDLRVSTVDAPATAQSGNNIIIAWAVANNGSGATATNSWTDTVYLSPTSVLNTSTALLLGAKARTGILNAAGSYSSTATFTLPHGLAGSFYAFVVTDSNNNVFEGAQESNNSGFDATPVQITLSANPDLQVTTVTAPASGSSGQNITVGWTVRNFGSVVTDVGQWTDYLYLSRDQILDATDQNIGYVVHSGALAANASYTQSNSAAIPSGLSGPYYVFVTTDRNSVVYESSDTNNSGYAATAVQVSIPPPADLTVSSITVPTTGSPGQSATIQWAVRNGGANPANGTWTDSIYLSADNVWDINDALVGRVDHSGPLAPLASYSDSFTTPLPGVIPGNYRVLVRTDIRNGVRESDEGNNIGVSTGVLAVDATELLLGVSLSSQLSTGTQHYFKVNVPAGEDLRVSLDSSSANGANELFGRYEAMPDRGHYDSLYETPFFPDQVITIPTTRAGWYYILVRSELEPNGLSQYTIRTDLLQFGITGLAPVRGGDTGNVTVTMSGARFRLGLTARLVQPSHNDIPASEVAVISSTKLTARFNLSGKSRGNWTLTLNDPANGEVIAPIAFIIEEGRRPQLAVFTLGQDAFRIDTQTRYQIVVKNLSNVDAERVLLRVRVPYSPHLTAILETGSEADEGAETYAAEQVADEGGKRSLFAESGGALPPGAEATAMAVLVKAAPSYMAANVKIETTAVAATQEEVNSLHAAVTDHVVSQLGMSDEEANQFKINKIQRAGQIALAHWKGHYLWSPGLLLAAKVTCVLFPPSCPVVFVLYAAYEIYGVFELYFDLKELASDGDEFDARVVRSVDPNEKVAPRGHGAAAMVGAQHPLSYAVYFENVSTADAAAREIRVVDRLDLNLDPRSFRLTEIAFGPITIAVPANRSYHHERLDLGAAYSHILADITAGVDIQSGTVALIVAAVDPNTGDRPENPFLGVLFPNNEFRVGEGHLSYTVKAKSGVPTGSLIVNSASIVFDDNEPIVTNTVQNTLDAVPPSSMISPLAAVSDDVSFLVSWAGTDDDGGSGIKDFDVFVSDDDGEWKPWYAGVEQVSAVFTGGRRHRYRFYSVARDNVGNTEAHPAVPDAVTVVSSGVNTAPVIAPIANRSVAVGQTLAFAVTASDDDVPANTLSFSLEPGAPAGASINTANGIFTWTPLMAHVAQTYPITVQVTDNGTPSLSSMQTFSISVRTNQPPVAGADEAGTSQGRAVSISAAKLLLNDSDPDGDTLSLSLPGGSSVQGGTVALSSGNVTYLPGAGFYGVDSFAYTVSDGFGGSALGAVTVNVQPAFAPGANPISLTPRANGRMGLRMVGIPGRTYAVEASTDLITWAPVVSLTAGSNGEFEFEDPNAGTFNRRFYRLVAP